LSSPVLPLQRFPLIRSRSLEEAAQLQSTITANLRAEQLDRRVPFSWEANRFELGRLGFMASQYGASFRARSETPSRSFTLLLPLGGAATFRQDRRTAQLVPGRSTVMCSPAAFTDFCFESGYRGQMVTIPASLVESALDALTGEARTERLCFDPSIDLEDGTSAAVLRLVDFIVSEADREPSVLASPLVETHLVDALVSAVLTGLSHNYSHYFRARVSVTEPVYVRRVEEYIAANAHRPLTLANLAAAAGVGVRTISAAFRKHRGQAPMTFLRERRFELARKRLLASPSASVTQVALSCGFEHLGRFSVGYRERFGESPAETLRRAARRG
jgi:AraC-like DNA-binding protein